MRATFIKADLQQKTSNQLYLRRPPLSLQHHHPEGEKKTGEEIGRQILGSPPPFTPLSLSFSLTRLGSGIALDILAYPACPLPL